MTLIKFVIFMIIGIFFVFTYAMCMAAKTSDEDAERMYAEYLEYKRRKAEKDGDQDREIHTEV